MMIIIIVIRVLMIMKIVILIVTIIITIPVHPRLDSASQPAADTSASGWSYAFARADYIMLCYSIV